MNKINYQKRLEETIDKETKAGHVPTLFLHSCCAPCSSYVLEYLAEHFNITVFFYNPNITEKDEYEKRKNELKRLISEKPFRYPVKMIDGDYSPDLFFAMAKGKEHIPEGGERCFACYKLRMEAAAKYAAEHHFDFFTTTLSISPLKNAQKLNEIGEALAEEYGVPHLPSDFKKQEGYKRSIQLSADYNLYRQDFCGCVFSKKEREAKAHGEA